MIPEMKARFTDGILAEAAKRFGVDVADVKSIGGFESFVFEYVREGKPYVLKLNHSLRRRVGQVLGEIEWVNFLADHAVPVCAGIPSLAGNLVEVIPDGVGGVFLAASYEKAEGHLPEAADWNRSLFEAWGELIGRIHSATKGYTLPDPSHKRQEWYEEEQLKARKYLPGGTSGETGASDAGNAAGTATANARESQNARVIAFIEANIERLKQLPRTADSYGLVHSDVGHANFVVQDDGSIRLFDFDDIGYHYFVSDIAIVMYYALNYPPLERADRATYVQEFYDGFMAGYRRHNHLDRYWLEYLPDFINLRHALQLVVFHQAFDVSELDDHGQMLLAEHRHQVLNGLEIADLVREIVAGEQ